jgi:hypothetical protein
MVSLMMMMKKVEDEPVQLLNEVDSVTRGMKAEDVCHVQAPKTAKERRLQFQNIVDAMLVIMEVGDEHPFRSQNEVVSLLLLLRCLSFHLLFRRHLLRTARPASVGYRCS